MAKGKRIPNPALATARNRRERRRLEKSLKKARRIAYCTKKSAIAAAPKPDTQNVDIAPAQKSPPKPRKPKKRKTKKQKSDKQRREMQQELIEAEEREIRSYAKKLGLNKRRKKDSVPKSFADAGLDYILEFCHGRAKETKGDDNEDPLSALIGSDDDIEGESDDDDVRPSVSFAASPIDQSRKRKASKPSSTDETPAAMKKRVRFSGLTEEDEDDDEDIQADESSDGDLAAAEDEEDPSSGDEGELREDIYGRLRDKKGNVVRSLADSSGRPRFIAAANEKGDLAQVDQKLVRSLKGSLNRLSESNARQTATQIGQLLLTYSKNDVKVVLTQSIFGVCLAHDLVPQRLVMEYCLLLAMVHSSVSAELSAYFIEQLAKEFRDLHAVSKDETGHHIGDKRLNNACQIFAFCYHLKVISNALMVQLIRDILKSFTERDIELMLLLLQSVGFLLRKENPADLKALMGEVHRKINAPENAHLKNESRTRFMLDTLNAIKNNNDTKVTNYDPSLTEHFRKLLRASVKTIETPLPMTLHDLYEAEEKGRWWIVGSAVSSSLIELKKLENNPRSKTGPASLAEFDDGLLELAKKHRMNTDLRRTIFCVIMSAEDYLDAFEKLLKLDLKGQQEREIIHVCLTCCVSERRFNPYYGLLVRHFCRYHKRFQLTVQFALWDKFKQLKEFEPWQRKNLALLLSQLVSSKAISLSVLKVFEFGELDTAAIKLLKTFFKDLLLTCTTAEVEDIFKRASAKDEMHVFFDGVLIFLQHFLSRGGSTLPDEKREALNERIAAIERLRFK